MLNEIKFLKKTKFLSLLSIYIIFQWGQDYREDSDVLPNFRFKDIYISGDMKISGSFIGIHSRINLQNNVKPILEHVVEAGSTCL